VMDASWERVRDNPLSSQPVSARVVPDGQ